MSCVTASWCWRSAYSLRPAIPLSGDEIRRPPTALVLTPAACVICAVTPSAVNDHHRDSRVPLAGRKRQNVGPGPGFRRTSPARRAAWSRSALVARLRTLHGKT